MNLEEYLKSINKLWHWRYDGITSSNNDGHLFSAAPENKVDTEDLHAVISSSKFWGLLLLIGIT